MSDIDSIGDINDIRVIRSDDEDNKPNLTSTPAPLSFEKPQLTQSVSNRTVPMDNINLIQRNFNKRVNTQDNISNNSEEYEETDDEITVNTGEDDDSSVEYVEEEEEEEEEPRKMTYEEILQKKQEVLVKIQRLQERHNIQPSRKFCMTSDLNEMEMDLRRMVEQRGVDKSIKFQRQILIGFVGLTEHFNNKFDPLDVDLDGFSQHIMQNINDYDDVFEELYYKYNEKVAMAPEVKLIFMVFMAGFTFNMSKKMGGMFDNININEILEKDPRVRSALNESFREQQYNKNNSMNGPNGVDDILSELNGS